ncbi:MAG: 3-hydroxyisobutyrate dehydrogenase [Pseudomonadota bacterium]
MEIGFIGLGNMGRPMAETLAAAGYSVTGFDTAAVSATGVVAAASAAAAAGGREIVVTMLPDGPILDAVADAALPAMAPGSVLVDCSTVDVATARAVGARAEAAGIGFVDAPVSGGIAGAAAGTLTFMVGGAETSVAMALPLFEVMGARTVQCGPAGSGQAAKICNNMILGISMLGVCEAFDLAERLGLDWQALYDVVSTSSGACWSVTSYCPAPGIGPKSPADNAYTPGFAAELMLKDLKLSQEAAISAGGQTEMGRRATELYEAFVATGGRGKDFSAVLARLRDQLT